MGLATVASPFSFHGDSSMRFVANMYSKIVDRFNRYVSGIVLEHIDYHQLAEWIDDARLRACVDHESIGEQLVRAVCDGEESITKLSNALIKGRILDHLDYDLICDVINRDLDYDDLADRVANQVSVSEDDIADKVVENIDEDSVAERVAEELAGRIDYTQIAMALARAAVKTK